MLRVRLSLHMVDEVGGVFSNTLELTLRAKAVKYHEIPTPTKTTCGRNQFHVAAWPCEAVILYSTLCSDCSSPRSLRVESRGEGWDIGTTGQTAGRDRQRETVKT